MTLVDLATAAAIVSALAGWGFVLAYQVRTRGAWRRTALGWHLMTFTACIALIFSFIVLIRVIGPWSWLPVAAVALYWLVALLLVQRFVLMLLATRRER